MSDAVVDIRGLSRRFGKTVALEDVSLQLLPGRVYGLVGGNGAGKTTLIKHILGLLKPQVGSVRVFGLEPVLHPVPVLSRIGYLSEERDLPDWMRIDELMWYTQAFHPNWDPTYAKELIAALGLDPSKRVKDLSKGMRAQTGLIAAVAHRPELLLLDEPSTGLDAVVRRDILDAIVRTVADNGRTVLFSSHLLDEVEQMSDEICMIHNGRLVLQGSVDQIHEQHQMLSLRFPREFERPPKLEGMLAAEGHGRNWQVVCNGDQAKLTSALQAMGGEIVHARNASLQEIFVARVGRDCWLSA